MKAGDLDGATEAQFFEELIHDTQEIVVVEEVLEDPRVDEQRRLDGRRRAGGKPPKFAGQVLDQRALTRGKADGVADLVGLEYAPGEGAEVEPDHDGGDPPARVIDDQLLIHV
jgi:hypothetical protein